MLKKSIITVWAFAVLLAPLSARADSPLMETTPTAWWWYRNLSNTDIVDIVDETGARLIDIELESIDPLRFAAAFVHNSGVYAETWWWYFDLTPGDIETLLDRNEARLIDIERYNTASGTRYAVIMLDNSGADAKAWWWYVGLDDALLDVFLDENDARLVDIEAYQDGGTKYAAIMIDNTGADAMEWWWYFNEPATTIWNNIAAHDSRLLEFQVRDPVTHTFDAIMIPNEEPDNINWWWYYDVTEEELNALLSQNGARIADLDTYLSGIQRVYSVVMVNNSNELTTKMGELLGYGSDGSTGFYLKEVDGPVLASLQPTFVYEPSSTIKVTHHLYAMRQVMIGAESLNAQLTIAEGITGLSCPNGGEPFVVHTLEQALRHMMQLSDNTDTAAIEGRYGRAAINAMSASVVGMTNTSINHTLGCAELPLNEMTLVDAALLYESVAQGLLLDTASREDFYRMMQSENTLQPWWFTVDMQQLINEVATDLGIPEMAEYYWDNTHLAWKPGGDTFDFGDVIKHYRSISGWVSLPWDCGEPGAQNREFVFGLFIHGASDSAYCDSRYFGHTIELFRELVTAGLESCAGIVGDCPEPVSTRMLQATYPNPFNPCTVIELMVDRPQHVSVSIFDIAGRRVVVLEDREFTAGGHRLTWDGCDAAGRPQSSGVYLVRLRAADVDESRKIILLR